jgi:hypothetical protein
MNKNENLEICISNTFFSGHHKERGTNFPAISKSLLGIHNVISKQPEPEDNIAEAKDETGSHASKYSACVCRNSQ